METIGYAIVGAGYFGAELGRIMKEQEGARVAAILDPDNAEAIAAELPNPAEVKVLKGTSPADLIVNCAKDEGCDLIIMGSRGQGGVKGFLGSVSYAVTKESPVTVLIAKEGVCQ